MITLPALLVLVVAGIALYVYLKQLPAKLKSRLGAIQLSTLDHGKPIDKLMIDTIGKARAHTNRDLILVISIENREEMYVLKEQFLSTPDIPAGWIGLRVTV